MDIRAVLVTDFEAPKAIQPGEGSFDHPTVASQAVQGLDADSRDAGMMPRSRRSYEGNGRCTPFRHAACGAAVAAVHAGCS